MAIKNFVPEKYYSVSSNEKTNGEAVELLSKAKFAANDLEKANALCEKYNSSRAFVASKKVKKDTLAPGKLYSLTKLQNVLGKNIKCPWKRAFPSCRDYTKKDI